MPDKVGRAVLEIVVDNKQYKFALGEVNKQADKSAKHIKSISQGMNFLVFKQAAGMAVRALKQISGAVAELGSRGAAVDDVSGAFRTLSENMGSSADVMLHSLRAGVKGTLSDMDLMMLANKALGAGLIKSSDDMETLAAGARSLGKATGIDTKQAFEAMMTAIASGRTASLKQLGIFVDSKAAIEDYAAAMGKSISEINDTDRAAALSAATIAALRDRLATIPPAAADFGEMLDFAKAQMTNFVDQIGVGIARSPVMIAGLQGLGNALGQAFGGENEGNVSRVTEMVGEFGIGITHVAEGVVMAGQFMARVWAALKTGINTVLTAIFAVGKELARFVRVSADAASHLPMFSEKAAALSAAAGKMEARFKGVRDAMVEQTIASSEGVLGYNAMASTLGKVRETIQSVRTAMHAAKGATVETTGAVANATTEMATAGAFAAQKIEETAQKVLETKRRLQQEIDLLDVEGSQKQLLMLQQKEQNEILSLERIKGITAAQREELLVLVREKYAKMTEAAKEHEATVVEAAKAAGFATRAALQQTASKALALYNRMKQSGKFTAEEIKKAWEAAETAKLAATGQSTEGQLKLGDALLSGTTSTLQILGSKNKAAAIAGAVLATYQAIAKALASAPWPANLALAAGAAAAGWANVSKIKSSDPGYKTGTPGLDFAGFGRQTSVNLHGDEAVIPRGGGHQLAGEIASSMPGGDSASLERLDRIAESLEELPQTMTKAFRNAMATA